MITILVSGPEPGQQPQHCGFGHRDAARGRTKIFPRQMQEDRTASSRDSRTGVVIDLDDEIVQVVLSLEPVASGNAFSRSGRL